MTFRNYLVKAEANSRTEKFIYHTTAQDLLEIAI